MQQFFNISNLNLFYFFICNYARRRHLPNIRLSCERAGPASPLEPGVRWRQSIFAHPATKRVPYSTLSTWQKTCCWICLIGNLFLRSPRFSEGGFTSYDRFVYLSLGADNGMLKVWQAALLSMFLKKGLIDQARVNMLKDWKHSGFSIESETRLFSKADREALGQYVVHGDYRGSEGAW